MNETFAARWWKFKLEKAAFEEHLMEVAGEGFDLSDLRADSYDTSIEIDDVPPSARLNEAAQRLLAEAGFSRAYLNHTDGWQTHYVWPTEFKPVTGWGRRRREDGGFDITYWPDDWTTTVGKDWLSSGFIKIVKRP